MNEVIRNLFVCGFGEWTNDVYERGWSVLCVLETCQQPGFTAPPIPNTKHIKILEPWPKAQPARLDEAADWIHAELAKGQRVLVHCGAGLERSPLTIAWYLKKYHGMNLDRAYAEIRLARPQVYDRQSWLPWEMPDEAP
jgi:protein-tyrosine phosphatase